MVAFYAVAQKIYSIPARSLNATMHAMIPAASELDALLQKKTLRKLFLRVLKYNLSILFMLSIPTVFLARHILKYWIGWTGGGFQFYYWVTIILIVSLFFDYFNYVSSQILIGMNKLKFFVACYGVVAIFNLVLSIILVQDMGIVGVAVGTTIPFIVMAPVLMWHMFRVIEVRWLEYIKTVWLPNIPFAALNVLVIYSLLYFHKPGNLIEVGLYYVISISVFFIPYYHKGLDARERNDIKGIFSSVTYRESEEVGETDL
jgi:O-antigen/teichoic acid export membrane protein